MHELQRSLGLGAEWLPPRRCRELEPGLTPSFNGGVHAPDEAAVDPRALTRRAAGRARGRGGRAADRDRGRRRRCSTASGSPASAPRPARSCGRRPSSSPPAPGRAAPSWLPEHARPPVRPVKGQILELRARDGGGALRADRRLRARLPRAAPRRPPDRRRDGRGAGLRHRGDRGRRPRAAARGLPAAARGRRDGAGRGDRRAAAGDARQPAAGRPGRASTACSGRAATTATGSCWRR